MKLPFFYPEHPEFKAQVEYVLFELLGFRNMAEANGWSEAERVDEAVYRAKDIVLHITSHKPTWWERLLSRLRGEQAVDTFEAGLEKWLRESIERAYRSTQVTEEVGGGVTATFSTGTADQLYANLLRELGLDDAREEQS